MEVQRALGGGWDGEWWMCLHAVRVCVHACVCACMHACVCACVHACVRVFDVLTSLWLRALRACTLVQQRIPSTTSSQRSFQQR